MARPSKYTDALAATICARIANGESLRTICKDPAMPGNSTVFAWLAAKPEFQEQYARAHEAQADKYAEETIEIADEEVTMVKRSKHGGEDDEGEIEVVFDSAAVARNRLRVDARKWYASKLAPKKYGDKLAVGGDVDAPPIAHKVDVTLTPDEAYLRMIGK